MTLPPSTRWGQTIATELANHNITAACIAPGSRSTPLTLPLALHDDIETFVHLDERSASYFSLGRAKQTGRPTPLVCTSGTAAANFHPAVIEADRARVPMLLLTADRPPELHESGANQTIPQDRLYADAVRWQQTLPEPTIDSRALNSLRSTIARAIAISMDDPPGPVHLNVPFKKPLEPPSPASLGAERSSDKPPDKTTPLVTSVIGQRTLTSEQVSSYARLIERADAGLIVAGPMNPFAVDPEAITALASATGFPLLADPLSGLRFGPHIETARVCGGYDAYLAPAIATDWPIPDLVIRFGAPPTSTNLCDYLARTSPRQLLIDPTAYWRDATFTSTDHVATDPTWFSTTVSQHIDRSPTRWSARFEHAESTYWEYIGSTEADHEGTVLSTVIDSAPNDATIFVANSMPVRDLDRFAPPQTKPLTVIGNRGASGIDGNTSTAIGAGSTTTDHLVIVLGDLAFFHDLTGLVAIDRFDVPATIVVINNDGGGIFHMLPIESFTPPFESHFKTPHGLDFDPVSRLYDFSFERVPSPRALQGPYQEAVSSTETHLIEVMSDGEGSHRTREQLQSTLHEYFSQTPFS